MQNRTTRASQRGAVAVFAAVALLAMLTATLVAIEIGRMYAARSELQKQANLAALDAARLVSGCSVDGSSGSYDAPSSADLLTFVQQALVGNGLPADLLNGLPQVDVGIIDRRTGVDGPEGMRYLAIDPEDAQAVRVTLRRQFPQPLLPLLPYDESRVMVASATAGQLAVGSFYLGSGLLNFDGGILNALLSGLLGGNVSLSVADYNGLVGVGVSLENLATAINLDVKDLSDPIALGAATPVLSDVIGGLAGSLSGTASAGVVAVLQQLAATAQAGHDSQVPIASLLGAVDGDAGEAPFVNLLDLLIALGAAASADETGTVPPIALPVSLGLPGIASVSTFVQIGEPPQFSGMRRAGTAEAHTAQIKLLVRAQVTAHTGITQALSLLLLGGLLGDIDAPPINLGVDVDVARASAYLDRIQCPRSTNNTLAAHLRAIPSAAALKLGTFAGAPASAPAISDGSSSLLGVTISVLGGLLAEIKVNLTLTGPVTATVGGLAAQALEPIEEYTKVEQPSGKRPYWLADVAPQASQNPQTVGTTGLLAGTFSTLFASLATKIQASDPDHPDQSSSICLLRIVVCTLSVPVGSIIDSVKNPVVSVLGTVLGATGGIVDGIIDPLLEALGIQIGTARVTMTAISVDQPAIISMELPAAP